MRNLFTYLMMRSFGTISIWRYHRGTHLRKWGLISWGFCSHIVCWSLVDHIHMTSSCVIPCLVRGAQSRWPIVSLDWYCVLCPTYVTSTMGAPKGALGDPILLLHGWVYQTWSIHKCKGPRDMMETINGFYRVTWLVESVLTNVSYGLENYGKVWAGAIVGDTCETWVSQSTVNNLNER